MALRALAAVSVLAGCLPLHGSSDPATDRDVAGTLHAPVVARYRGAIDHETHDLLASLPVDCQLDVLGSLRAISFGVHDDGAGGSLVAHGIPNERLRSCLASGHAPVAVLRPDVYRVAVERTEIEIRLVGGDMTWVRWAPQGRLGEPAGSRDDPYDLRSMVARVDRSATAWFVIKPSAADIRNMWHDGDLPPPVALAASVQLDRGVTLDAEYRTASSTAAGTTSDMLAPQLQLARTLLQLDVSVHAEGSALRFHFAATAATIQHLLDFVGALDSLGHGDGESGSTE